MPETEITATDNARAALAVEAWSDVDARDLRAEVRTLHVEDAPQEYLGELRNIAMQTAARSLALTEYLDEVTARG